LRIVTDQNIFDHKAHKHSVCRERFLPFQAAPLPNFKIVTRSGIARLSGTVDGNLSQGAHARRCAV
jgi:hypothetical protein